MMKKIINLTLFQIAWFAAVLGAANDVPWLGPLVMVPVLVWLARVCAVRAHMSQDAS